MTNEQLKMCSEMKFKMEYRRGEGDEWTYIIEMPNGKSRVISYKLGQKFDSSSLIGRLQLVTISISHYN